MYTPKATVHEKQSKSLCTIHWPHSIEYPKDHLISLFSGYFTTIVSIDPGTKNYAIRIGKRNNNTDTISSLYYSRWTLDLPNKNEGEVEIDKTYSSLNKKLNSIEDLIEQSDILIIERQLPINYNSTRIMQHTITYFEHIYDKNSTGKYPIIVLIAPQLKGKMLGAPRGLPKPQLKEWSIDMAYEILYKDNDTFGIKRMNEERKKDDLADVTTQKKAFLLYFGI